MDFLPESSQLVTIKTKCKILHKKATTAYRGGKRLLYVPT